MPFLTSLTAKLIGVGIACLVAAYLSYRVTDAFDQNTIKDMKLAQAQAVTDAWKFGWLRRDQQDRATTDANHANEVDQARIAANTGEVIRYVTRYVTPKNDAACVLNNGFVKLLDSAITGTPPDQLPGSSGEPDDAPSGLTLSQASALLAQTGGDYAGTRARIPNALDDWNKQAEIFDAQQKPAAKPSWWARNIGSL